MTLKFIELRVVALTKPAVEKPHPRKLGPSASSITLVFSLVWVKITVSYFVKCVKAANLTVVSNNYTV